MMLKFILFMLILQAEVLLITILHMYKNTFISVMIIFVVKYVNILCKYDANNFMILLALGKSYNIK